jgi:hypothetical protein
MDGAAATMREQQKHNYTDCNKYKDELLQETLQRSSSGVMFDDDFVDALAQRLMQRMQDGLPGKSRTHYSETLTTLRLLLAVLSVLAFVAVIAIVLKTVSLAWWMTLLVLGMVGTTFVLINVAFYLPRR